MTTKEVNERIARRCENGVLMRLEECVRLLQEANARRTTLGVANRSPSDNQKIKVALKTVWRFVVLD